MATTRIHNGLNKKEQKVLAQFVKAGRPHPMTLDELSEVFAYVGKAKSNSWVRNSIRKPVNMGLLTPTRATKGLGTYQLTEVGREYAKGLLGVAEPKAQKPAKAAKPAQASPAVSPAVSEAIAKGIASVNGPALVPEVVGPEVVVEAKLVESAKVEAAPVPAPEAKLTLVEPAPWENPNPA